MYSNFTKHVIVLIKNPPKVNHLKFIGFFRTIKNSSARFHLDHKNRGW